MRIQLGEKAYMLFDGDCGICTRAAEWVRKLDTKNLLVIEPYQNFSVTELSDFGINPEQCAKKLQVLTPAGKVYQGAFAVNYVGWQYLPWRLLVLVIYLFPPFLLLEIFGYWLVAKNRARISHWLGMRACLLKP